MSEDFSMTFHTRWSDLDPNFHMRHTCYADLCATARLSYLEKLGFPLTRFQKIEIGPILFTENTKFLKEVNPGEDIKVLTLLKGLSEDGRKWKILHELSKVSDGTLCATVEVSGAWMNLRERKVVAAPKELLKSFSEIKKSEDYSIIS